MDNSILQNSVLLLSLQLMVLLLSPSLVQSASLGTHFFPYGGLEGDSILQRTNGPGSSSQIIELVVGMRFYGNIFSRIIVNSNGVVKLGDQPLIRDVPSEAFPGTNTHIVAPYWASANYSTFGNVYYRISDSSVLLDKARNNIDQAYLRVGLTQESVSPSKLVILTWKDLRSATNEAAANTFQCIFAISSSSTYVFFQYADNLMEWGRETPVLIGFNAGDGMHSFTLPTSLSPAVLEATKTGNTGIRGQWLFRVDGGEVTLPGVIIGLSQVDYTTPETGAVEICASVLAGSLLSEERINPTASDITANDRLDYVRGGLRSLIFAPNDSTSHCTNLIIVDDSVYETDETLKVRITKSQQSIVTLLPRKATITIRDNDSVFVNYNSITAVEENGNAQICVDLLHPVTHQSLCSSGKRTQRPVQVTYTTFPGDAEAGVDYVAKNGTIFIHAGLCAGCSSIQLIDDEIFEEKEKLFYTIKSDSVDIVVNTSLSFANIFITDNDGLSVTVGITQGVFSVHEGEQVTVCTQMTSGTISQPLVVTIRTGHIDQLVGENIILASDDQDFIVLYEDLVFVPSQPREVKCVNLTTLRDNRYEGKEYRGIVLETDFPVTLMPRKSILHILDNNEVSVSIEKTHYDYIEGASNRRLNVCANLTGEIERDLRVHVEAQEGTASFFDINTARSGDVHPNIDDITFEVSSNTNIPPGSPRPSRICHPHCTACTKVTIQNDNVLEALFETFTLHLSHEDSSVHLTSTTATVSIMDNDKIHIILLNRPFNSELIESEPEVPTVCVQRNGIADVDFSVGLIPHGITATDDIDFRVNNDRITFFASDNERETKCNSVSVTIIDDVIVEEVETLELVLESDDPDRILVTRFDALQTRTLTIIDNDSVFVNFKNESFEVRESEGRVEVCTEMTGFTAIPQTVFFSTWPDSAEAGVDFLPRSISLQFPATDERIVSDLYNLSMSQQLNYPAPKSPPICINVSIIDDDILEANKLKSFFLNLSHPDPGVILRSPHVAVMTIEDDDDVIIIIDEASRNVIVHEGESAHICARMLTIANFVVTASFQPLPITQSARETFDFIATEQQFEFPANSNALQCVTIQTVDGTTVEREETFEVKLRILEPGDTRLRLGDNVTSIVTIVDNNFVEVGFESSEYSVLEGEGVVEVCATLTGILEDGIPVSVILSVSEQDQGVIDYIHPPDTPFFQHPSNQSSQRKCIHISISNDTILEDTESFDVMLRTSSDRYVHITQGISTVYIIDDDGVRVGLKEREMRVLEGERNSIPICVELIGVIQRNIAVLLTTRSLTATADRDYNTVSTLLNFSPEEATEQETCIQVSLIDDSVFEDEESFLVSLMVEHAAVSIHIRSTNISIVDNDHAILTMATNETALDEDVGGFDLCVELHGATEIEVYYHLNIRPLEAVLGSDFLFTSDTDYSFPAFSGDQHTQCHHITIIDDAVLEDTEHFEAELFTMADVPRLSVDINRTEMTILDNDAVRIGFSQREYTVDEDGSDAERTINVCIGLSGEIEREVIVLVTSRSGSADSADDFDAVDEEISFSPAETNYTHCFIVFVRNDRIVEENEMFFLISSSIDPAVILDPLYVQFTITDEDVICLSSSLDTSRGYFMWLEAFPGEVSEVLCENGTTKRNCSLSGEWQKPSIKSCYVSTEELFRYIGKHGFSEDNLEETLFAINQLHREKESPSTKYVETIDMILLEFADLTERNEALVDYQIFSVLVEIINGIQTWPKDVLVEYSSSIINSFEKTTVGIFKPSDFASFNLGLKNVSFSSKKGRPLELFPQDKSGLKFTFHKDKDGNIIILNEDRSIGYEASITFPKSMAGELPGSTEAGLYLTYYDSGVMFPLGSNETKLSSITPVVAASFAGLNLENLGDNVVITFKLEHGKTSNVTCVSWDFGANDGLGKWIENGCTLVSLKDDEATCACKHLTNFACLIDVSPTSDGLGLTRHKSIISLLSIIGSSVSILGLLLTILTLLLFSQLRRRDNTKYRIQLCMSIILLLIAFITGIDQVETFGFCVAISAFVHYFTLVSVMWLAAELVLTFQKLIGVFSHPSTCFLVAVSLLCWLLPIVSVVVPIGIDRNFAISDRYCFSDHNIVLFGSLLGPLGALVVFMLIVFLMILCTIIGYSSKFYKGEKKVSKQRGACRSIFVILTVMVLYGLTWTFGAFTVRGASEYFQFIFIAFNSLLGFFIFVMFVVFSKETQDLLLQTCGCKKKRKREKIVSAIIDQSIGSPRLQRIALTENADRLRALEEVDLDLRLGMTSWDITFVPQNKQEDIYKLENIIKEQDLPSRDTRLHSPQENPPELPSGDVRLLLPDSSLGENSMVPHFSPSHSMDSIQNAMESESIADSGILMDKMIKNTPSPTLKEGGELQHPQSGCMPRHTYSVSGIGYISADSSLENIPARVEENCYIGGKIDIAPTLRPRAIPNEYARLHVE